MATKKALDSLVLALIFLYLFNSLTLCSAISLSEKGLSYGFYEQTCPNVERIIFSAVSQKFSESPQSAAGALRIFFHDCFVEGCDASVLIASTSSNKAEKEAEINMSLSGDGFDLFFRAKRAVESHCPGVVSCSDVMAIATRDSVYMLGGPRWEVQKGRRDGLISQASGVALNIPQVNQTLPKIISLFQEKGLTVEDLVALSGAHSVGASHCIEFMPRLYGFNRTFDIDPTMDPNFAQNLRATCPQKTFDPTVVAQNDINTPLTLDNTYYHNLQKGFGLLATDQILTLDPRTKDIVSLMSKDQETFFSHFVEAMIKLSVIEVKIGSDGEIRRDCASFNG